MFDFCGGERFGKRVSDHVSCGTIDKPEGPLFDDPANEMIADVDMFGPGVILVIPRESDRGLIVRKQCSGTLNRGEDVAQETA